MIRYTPWNREKLEKIHFLCLKTSADEYLYGPMTNEELPVFEFDNPVSLPHTLSRPGQLHSLFMDKIVPGLLDKEQSSPAALKISTLSLKAYHVSTNPPARNKEEKLSIPKRNQMNNTLKIDRPELL